MAVTGTSHDQDLAAPRVNLQEAKAQRVAVSGLVTAHVSGQLDLPHSAAHSGFLLYLQALLSPRTEMVSKHLNALEASWNLAMHHFLLKSYRGRFSFLA